MSSRLAETIVDISSEVRRYFVGIPAGRRSELLCLPPNPHQPARFDVRRARKRVSPALVIGLRHKDPRSVRSSQLMRRHFRDRVKVVTLHSPHPSYAPESHAGDYNNRQVTCKTRPAETRGNEDTPPSNAAASRKPSPNPGSGAVKNQKINPVNRLATTSERAWLSHRW